MTIGKQNSTLIKNPVKESKLITTGVKSIKFWHEASAGDTSIPFGSLIMPASVAANGHSNPTSTTIMSANLALFQNNVEVHSFLNGELLESTYVVKNNQITFVSYVALEGEIFRVKYKDDVITGTNVVDARPLTATGILLTGDTEFNVGEAFKTNAYPNTQLGEVLVFVDGICQFRNVANATATPLADGNYQEVHSVDGFGSIIKFNDVFGSDKNIQIISRNLIAERPDISMLQLIDSLGGQIDGILQTVADLAGVDISTFQTNPNQVDLKAFGDKVTENKALIDINSNFLSTATKLEFHLFNFSALGNTMTSSGAGVQRFGTLDEIGDGGLLSYDDSTGEFTALEDCIIKNASWSWLSGAASSGALNLISPSKILGRSTSEVSKQANFCSAFPLTAGQKFNITNSAGLTGVSTQILNILAERTVNLI